MPATFLEFGRATWFVFLLPEPVQRLKFPMARSNEPNMSSKGTKIKSVGYYRNQISLNLFIGRTTFSSSQNCHSLLYMSVDYFICFDCL